jgi:hypothetical protein
MDNIETRISYEKISAFYEHENETLVSVVTLNIAKKNPDSSDETYLVMKDFSNIEFKEAYNEQRALDSVYIKLDQQSQDISFSTTEDINFKDIPAYVTTNLKNLNVLTPGEPLCNKND